MINNIFLKPLYTEKSLKLAQSGFYTFAVPLEATKPQIKASLKNFFEVDAKTVRTMITKGALKRVGKARKVSKKADIKKAIVTLQKGQKLSVFEPEKEGGK